MELQNLLFGAVHAPGLAAASASATTAVLQDTYKWDADLKRCYRSLPGELPDFGTIFTNECDDRLYARFQDETVKEMRGSVEDGQGKGNSRGQKKGKNQGKSPSSNSVCPTSKKKQAKWIATPRHPTGGGQVVCARQTRSRAFDLDLRERRSPDLLGQCRQVRRQEAGNRIHGRLG